MSRMSNLTDIVPEVRQVTLSSTPIQLSATATNLAAGVVTVIKATQSNVGEITLANSQAAAVPEAGNDVFVMQPGESITVQIKDLSRIWVGAWENGDGVNYIYER